MAVVTGSVSRTSTQKVSEQISVLDFGAKGDGTTNDTTAINTAIAYCASLGKVCFFPAKVYSVTNLATLTANNTMLRGEPGARLKFTGSGVGIPIDGTTFGGNRVVIQELILDGNAAMTYCIDALFMVGGELRNVRCTNCTAAAVRLRNCVLCLVDSLVVSQNIQAFTTRPVTGIILDQGPAAGSSCGGNTIINPRIEGVSGPGIDIASAITTTIVGGSSEGNGTGIITRQSTSKQAIIGIDLEVNTVCDLDIAGGMADFYCCDCSSATSVIIRSTGGLNHFYGGYYDGTVTINTGGQYNTFDRISIKGTITDNGDHNVFSGLFNTATLLNIPDKQWADKVFNGKIGVGATPAVPLQIGVGTVANSSRTNCGLEVWQASILDDSVGNVNVYTTDAPAINKGGSIGLGGSISGNTPYANAKVAGRAETATGYAGYLQFLVTAAASNMVERMRITSLGRVGIGVTNPGYLLDVAGDVNASGQYRLGGVSFASKNALTNFVWSQTGGNFKVTNGSGTADLLTVLDGGNVGIGTGLTPAYKLDITGDCNLSAGSVYRVNGTPISGGGGFTDPTTTKGDLIARGTAGPATRLGPVGADGQVLTADSASALGVKWAAPGSAPVSSVFTRTGAVVAASGDYAAFYVPLTTQVIAGTGLTGGGALSANVTLTAKAMVASGASHSAGIVPDPGATAGTAKFLREDATWVVPAQTPWTGNIDGGGFTLSNVNANFLTTPLVNGVKPVYRTGNTWALVGDVTSLTTLPSVFIPLSATQSSVLFGIRAKIGSGTSVGVQVVRNGSNVGSVITVTTTATTTTTGFNTTLADGDEIALVLSSPVGTPSNLTVSLILTQTQTP